MKRALIAAASFAMLSCTGGDAGSRLGFGEFGEGPGGNAAGGTALPCDVEAVLATHCLGCHAAAADARQFGAPMGLATWEQTQAAAAGGRPIFEEMLVRVHDQSAPMPPPNFPRPTEQDLKVLNDWAASGAPPSDGTCGTAPPVGQPGPGEPGPGGQPPPPGGGPPAPPPVNPPPANDECVPYRFTARQTAANDKFHVPPRPEVYQCFIFTVPWQEPNQAFSFRPVLDNTKVLHHWLLYSLDTPEADGANYECLGAHPNAELVAGWAPGAPDYNLPGNVGLALPPPGSSMLLEIHYFNPPLAPTEMDQSGVEICASGTFRQETATVSWLGNELIVLPPRAETPVQGTCTPAAQTPITILRSWPHMHTHGFHFNSTIHRAGGGVEPMLDVPFDFNNQAAYDTPAVINPGDRINSTCFFRNTTDQLVTFGESTLQEMCYNFVWAYPAKALTSLGITNRNQCML